LRRAPKADVDVTFIFEARAKRRRVERRRELIHAEKEERECSV
jgi:hypothetical protein